MTGFLIAFAVVSFAVAPAFGVDLLSTRAAPA